LSTRRGNVQKATRSCTPYQSTSALAAMVGGYSAGNKEQLHRDAGGVPAHPQPRRIRHEHSAIRDPRSRPSPATPSSRLVSVRGKALATATLGRRLRIAERELLVQTLLQEVHLGPVDQLQAVGIDKDAH